MEGHSIQLQPFLMHGLNTELNKNEMKRMFKIEQTVGVPSKTLWSVIVYIYAFVRWWSCCIFQFCLINYYN